MPVVQTPIPGDQLANMDEQMRAMVGAVPSAPAISEELLRQAVAGTPEQELARLSSAMNAPLPPEMPMVSMAQEELPIVGMQEAWNPSSMGLRLAPTGAVSMNTGGMVQDAMRLQAAGRGPHDRLVHMTEDEVNAMNALAASGIGGLRANGMAINPETGLPEAGIWSNILPIIAGVGLTIASGGTAAPWALGLAGAGGSFLGQMIDKEPLDLGRMFMAGLGGWGAGKLGQVFGGAGEVLGAQGANTAIIEGVAQPLGRTMVESGVAMPMHSMFNPSAGAFAQAAPAVTQAVAPASVFSDLAAKAAGSSGLYSGMDVAAQNALQAQFANPLTQSAALKAAGEGAYMARPTFDAVTTGMGGFSPTSWASTPGAVGWQDVLMPGAAVAASAADFSGAYDQPEGYAWDEIEGIGPSYDYQGPYLPRSRTAVLPSEEFQPGIDPQFQYFSYANKGGPVGGLPTIRAQSGYEQYNLPRSQQQQQGSPVFNQLAMMGAGLGGQRQAAPTLSNQGFPQYGGAARGGKQPVGYYTSSISSDKLPMLRPQQTATAAHGGPVGNLIDPQYRWSDTPDPMMREQVYRRANGGLAGIDPQYRWSDVANPAMREHLYHPTVRAEEGKRGDENAASNAMSFLEWAYNGPGRAKLPPYYAAIGTEGLADAFQGWREDKNAATKHAGDLQKLMEQPIAKARGGIAGIDPQYRWSDVPNPADREHLYRPTVRAQEGKRGAESFGVAGEPVMSETGIMDVATPDMQEAVAERNMVVPAPDQPQNPAERVVFDQAVLALQGELEPEPAQAAITEFIDIFGPEAFRQLQALVGGERENGGLVQTASGETTVGMSEEEAKAQQGPDVIPGKIVDPTTGQQTANLLVGENEYIEPADSLSRRAMAAGMAATPQNGAIVRGQEEEQLRRAYG